MKHRFGIMLFVFCFFLTIGSPKSGVNAKLLKCNDLDNLIKEVATKEKVPFRLLQAIVKVESNYNPFAIGVNVGGQCFSVHSSSETEACAKIRELLREGRNIDIGLAQINIKNILLYGIPVQAVLDPEVNLTIAARLLSDLIKRYGLTWEAVWRYNGSKRYAYKVYEALK